MMHRCARVVGIIWLGLCAAPVRPAAAQGCAGSWSPMGTGMNGSVYALTVLHDGDLVAAGFFSTAGGAGAARVARWDGAGWSPMGAGIPTPGGYARALTTLTNGDLIAGGIFDTAGSAGANSVARWDGTAWSPLGSGTNNPVHVVLALPASSFVAGGSFTNAGGITAVNAAICNAPATQWGPLGLGTDSTVTSFATLLNGELVVGGVFFSAGGGIGGIPAGGLPGTNCIARYNLSGGGWSSLGGGVNYSAVWALTVLSNGDLIAGGDFTTAGGISASRIARWDGAAWNPLGTGINGTVYALTTLTNGDLLAGGEFNTAGGIPAVRIARWSPATATWSAMGAGMNATVRALAQLQNGDVIAGGDFSTAGGAVALEIARWSQPSPPSISTQPVSATTCASGTAHFSLAASGATAYQWQVATAPGTWAALSTSPLTLPCGGSASATAPTSSQTDISISPCTGTAAYQVRCVVSGTCGSATSNEATYSICYANCDCSSTAPVVNVLDFSCFLNKFAAGDPYANCDNSTTPPVLNVLDFACFLNKFASGCS